MLTYYKTKTTQMIFLNSSFLFHGFKVSTISPSLLYSQFYFPLKIFFYLLQLIFLNKNKLKKENPSVLNSSSTSRSISHLCLCSYLWGNHWRLVHIVCNSSLLFLSCAHSSKAFISIFYSYCFSQGSKWPLYCYIQRSFPNPYPTWSISCTIFDTADHILPLETLFIWLLE